MAQLENLPSRERESTVLRTDRYYRSPRALVVEDDLWMQPIIKPALRAAISGVAIDWVETAEEALRKSRVASYSLILADICLKQNGSTGIDLWYSWRSECPEVPVLLMSSIPVDLFTKKMAKYGPMYLPKPFGMGQCADVIRNMISFTGAVS
jgi:DNA-binding NtrC family response regulator